MTPLTSPSINAVTVDSATKRLLHEYVARWFDGADHDVPGTGVVPFPRATVKVLPLGLEGAGLPGEPTDATDPGLWISLGVVWGGGYHYQGVAGDEHVRHAQLQCWLRTAAQAPDHALMQSGCDLLYAVLNTPNATLPLICKGFNRLRPRPAILVSNSPYAVRLLACSIEVGWLQAEVLENP